MVSKQPGPPRGRQQPQQMSKGQKWGCGCASVALFFLAVGSCGAILGDDEPTPKPSATPTTTASESPTPTPSVTPSETAQDNAVDDDDDHHKRHHKSKKTSRPATSEPAPDPAPYFSNCSEARAAGAAPLHAGEPGYRPGLDRDRDGTACDS